MSKPFRKLTRADLKTSPVWEWYTDGLHLASDEDADESWVTATPYSKVPIAEFAQFIVSASIELSDGNIFSGIAEVTVAHTEVAVMPTVVFLLDRHLQIPSIETNRLLSRYTKQIENHPKSCKLDVLIEGETVLRSNTIKGGDMKESTEELIFILQELKSINKN